MGVLPVATLTYLNQWAGPLQESTLNAQWKNILSSNLTFLEEFFVGLSEMFVMDWYFPFSSSFFFIPSSKLMGPFAECELFKMLISLLYTPLSVGVYCI